MFKSKTNETSSSGLFSLNKFGDLLSAGIEGGNILLGGLKSGLSTVGDLGDTLLKAINVDDEEDQEAEEDRGEDGTNLAGF